MSHKHYLINKDYLFFVSIIFMLSECSFTDFQCSQRCSDLNACILSELNSTCLLMENGSCIPDEQTTKGTDICAENLNLSYERKMWEISWEPPNNIDFHYNGFIVTILTDQPNIYTYYMKVNQAPIFKMSCKIQSYSKYLPDLSEVCVQTLPRSSVLLSEGVKICFEWSPGSSTFSTTKSNPVLTSTMEQSESRTASGHMTIIGAVAVSTSIVVSVIIAVALYKYCRCKPLLNKNKEVIDTEKPSSMQNDQNDNMMSGTYNPQCPVHGGSPHHDTIIEDTVVYDGLQEHSCNKLLEAQNIPREHQVQTKCHNLAKEYCHLHNYQHINQPQQLNHTCLSSTRKDSMGSLTLSERNMLNINFK